MALKCPIQPFLVKFNADAIVKLTKYIVNGVGPLTMALVSALVLDALESGLDAVTAITQSISKAWMSIVNDLVAGTSGIMTSMQITHMLAGMAHDSFTKSYAQLTYIIAEFRKIRNLYHTLEITDYGERDDIWKMCEKLLSKALNDLNTALVLQPYPEYLVYYRRARNFVQTTKNILNQDRSPFKSGDISLDELFSTEFNFSGEPLDSDVKTFDDFVKQYTKALNATYVEPYTNAAIEIATLADNIINITTDISVSKFLDVGNYIYEPIDQIISTLTNSGDDAEIANPPLINNFSTASGYVTAINFWINLFLTAGQTLENDVKISGFNDNVITRIRNLRNAIDLYSEPSFYSDINPERKLAVESSWLFEITSIISQMNVDVDLAVDEIREMGEYNNFISAINAWSELPDINYLECVQKISSAALSAASLGSDAVANIDSAIIYMESQKSLISKYIAGLNRFPQYRYGKFIEMFINNSIIPDDIKDLFIMGKIPSSAMESIDNFMENIGIVTNIYEFLKPCFNEPAIYLDVPDFSGYMEIADKMKSEIDEATRFLMEKIPIVPLAEELMALKEQVSQLGDDMEQQIALMQKMLLNMIGNALNNTLSIEAVRDNNSNATDESEEDKISTQDDYLDLLSLPLATPGG